MKLKQLKEIIYDDLKRSNYSDKEIDEAKVKYKKSYEVLVERRDLENEYRNEFPTMPFERESLHWKQK